MMPFAIEGGSFTNTKALLSSISLQQYRVKKINKENY
uniref:Uncharacterized protein n=1 Tax=Manihot esculenta TaxID=3983 RepID=A0A2C9V426_MANES